MNINFSEYSASQRYHIMTQTLIPRPIAWVLTHSVPRDSKAKESVHEQNLNLAPFSYFTAVSSDPAILMLSIGKKENGNPKDTIVNTVNNKKLVIHIANEQQAAVLNSTAASLAHGDSELVAVNSTEETLLHTVPFDDFDLPRLAQCDIAYGCELYEIKELGNTPQTLLFVEIKQIYLNDNIVELDQNNRMKIFADKVMPLARLGANEYAGITAPFQVNRPS